MDQSAKSWVAFENAIPGAALGSNTPKASSQSVNQVCPLNVGVGVAPGARSYGSTKKRNGLPRHSKRLSGTAKVYAVYYELRRSLGTRMPSVTVLNLAHQLVDAAAPLATPIETADSFRSMRLECLPLDQAIKDGGWRVMQSENRWTDEYFEDVYPRLAVQSRRWPEMELSA